MTYDPIDSGEVALGKVASTQFAQKVKGNFDFLYARRIVLMSPPTIISTAVGTGWNDFTITPNPGDNAEIAILLIRVSIVDPSASNTGSAWLEVRKKDDANWVFKSNCPGVRASVAGVGGYPPAADTDTALVMVPLNASNQFQGRYAVDGTLVVQERSIKLIGYVAKE